ncbi:MAG: SET domain-containing protein-lysine N-methyltransferase [Proteobacteria bacterium]|nr:SET domain-containing protein-lysine N-methyltransferase [Pseudomonadota bacterium]
MDKIAVGKNKYGLGVFCITALKKGERILDFSGPAIVFEYPLSQYQNEGHAVQVGYDSYIVPQGHGYYVNHSCHPNAIIEAVTGLAALRDIDPGEEICFDYSTGMDEDSWTMRCLCGSPHCRGLIKDFKYLPPELQRRYLQLNAVPPFVTVDIPKVA